MKNKALTIAAAVTYMAISTPTLAQDDLVFNSTATERCLSSASIGAAQRACIGKSAERCMEVSDGGYSTYGMGGCLSKELDYWDAWLNHAYKKLRAHEKADDAEMAELGSSVPSKAEALRDMQRAWITFRDSTCDYEMSQWSGGTGQGPALLSCLMVQTGRQALYLENAARRY